jgi:hypothetical protein
LSRSNSPVPLTKPAALVAKAAPAVFPAPKVETERCPRCESRSLTVIPSTVQLAGKTDYNQLIVSAKLVGGATLDVTRQAKFAASTKNVEILPGGVVVARADGPAALQITLGDKSISVPCEVKGTAAAQTVDYIRDVNPVLGRMGCNQGTVTARAVERLRFARG